MVNYNHCASVSSPEKKLAEIAAKEVAGSRAAARTYRANQTQKLAEKTRRLDLFRVGGRCGPDATA
ncbi:MAG TPA: hypothetical protein VGI29_03010 [Candidatus Binataceae bacterium]